VIVLDSSAAVEYLVGSDLGTWVDAQIATDPDLHAPHLIDVEVVSALRKLVKRQELAESIAAQALDDLADLDVGRYAHHPFLGRIWELRANVTACDAVYVALAESLDAPLLTTDLRLGRAPGTRATMLTP
jgi:predicted nucleic acid-binding protein